MFMICFITFYVLKEVFGLSHHKIGDKIDEFLNKLLKSNKFEKLADRIAEKAVERILELQPNLRITQDSKKDLQLEKAIRNTTHNTDVHIQRTATSFKELSLKYKYFTQNPLDDKQSKENNESSGNRKPASKIMSEKSVINSKNSTENADSDVSGFDSNQQQKDSNTDTTEHIVKSKGNKKVKNKRKRIRKGVKVKADSLSEENRKNELEEFKENKSESINHESNVEFRHIDEENSDFDNMVKNDKDLFDNVSKDTTKAADLKKKRKKRYRKEGTKIYTFMSSSDYDEYHEELDRLEKQRKSFI